jgi:hypothetical protein
MCIMLLQITLLSSRQEKIRTEIQAPPTQPLPPLSEIMEILATPPSVSQCSPIETYGCAIIYVKTTHFPAIIIASSTHPT